MKDVAGQAAEGYSAMFDASGKVAPGLLMGTLGDLGNFDECLATSVNNLYGERDFSGRFCTVYMNFKNNSFVSKMVDKFQQEGYLKDYKNPLRWIKNHMANGVRQSACIPSTCSADDLGYILNTMGKKIGMVARIRGCKAEGETKVTGWQTGILSTLATMAALVCVGTGIDIALRTIFKGKAQGRPRGVLLELALGFSIVSNTEKLLKTDPSDPADSKLQFIHGLRFYSSTWVMLGHAFLIADPTATGSLMNVVDLVEEFMTTLIANAFPSVETFLFISGFLLSYNVQKSLRNKTRLFLWVPLIILRRYIRLTVPAMFVVGVWLLVPLMADGPVLNDFKATFLDTCQRRWWSVMLHTNNFAPFLEMVCFPGSARSFVSFVGGILSELVCAIFGFLSCNGFNINTREKKKAPLLVSGHSASMRLLIIFRFAGIDPEHTVSFCRILESSPWTELSASKFSIGFGYLRTTKPQRSAQILSPLLCWSAAVACNVAIVFAPHKWYTDHSYSIYRPECLLFASLHRVAWTLGVGWVVFACATGRGGFVKSFLSWPALVPLSRLSYGAFLTHVVILLVQTMTNRERIAYTYMVKTMNYLAVVMASYLCAYVLFLFCEAPVATLERTLLGGRRSPATEMEPTKPNSEPSRTTENGHHHACGFVLPVRCGSPDESAQRSHL
ncbi:unnamed protein product [Ixodes persulcatus]